MRVCRTRISSPTAAIVASIILLCNAAVSFGGIVKTSAGQDQQSFHYPSVLHLRENLPEIDILGMRTATGPLYHILITFLTLPFPLNEQIAQFGSGMFSVALAALILAYAERLPIVAIRLLATAPLLLSAYFWQSSFWMLTDNLALLFAFAAITALCGASSSRREILAGVFIALSIATRQTYVWLMLPAIVGAFMSYRGFSNGFIRSVLRLVAPGAVVLAVLIHVWGGLTPPAMRAFNDASLSPTAVTFVAAVAGLFFVPIIIATGRTSDLLIKNWRTAVLLGGVAVLPSIVFPSGATESPDQSRRGGFVWQIVGMGGEVYGRSIVLMILGFVGAASCVLLFRILWTPASWIVAASVVGLGIVTIAGSQLYQKYAELPVAMLSVVVIVKLWEQRDVRRTSPLVYLCCFQAIMTVTLVVIPVLSYIQSPL